MKGGTKVDHIASHPPSNPQMMNPASIGIM